MKYISMALFALALSCGQPDSNTATAALLLLQPKPGDGISLTEFRRQIAANHTAYHTLLIGDSTMGQIYGQWPHGTNVLSSTGSIAYPGLRISEFQENLELISNPEPVEIVIGSTGINDLMRYTSSVPQVEADLLALLTAIHAKYPHARVSSYGLPPNTNSSSAVMQNRAAINAFVAAHVDCYLDTNPLFGIVAGQVPDARYFIDGLHFTEATTASIKTAFGSASGCNVPI